jgi:hypothetical protein
MDIVLVDMTFINLCTKPRRSGSECGKLAVVQLNECFIICHKYNWTLQGAWHKSRTVVQEILNGSDDDV